MASAHTLQSSTLGSVHIGYMTLRGTLNQRLSATPVMHIVAWNDNQSKDNCWFQRQNTQVLTTCIFLCDFASVTTLIYCRCKSSVSDINGDIWAERDHKLRRTLILL
jgi:hypothetical protein